VNRIKEEDWNDPLYLMRFESRREMIKNNKENKSPFSHLHHISIVVRDIDKAIKFYSSIGIVL